MRSLQAHIPAEVLMMRRLLAVASSPRCSRSQPRAAAGRPEQARGRSREFHADGQGSSGRRSRGGERQARQSIHGLTAKDFTLTEDGVPQTISFCEHEDLAETAKPLPLGKHGDENITYLQSPGAHADRSRIDRERTLQEPPPAGSLLRHDGDAASRPDARIDRRASSSSARK